MSAMLVLVLANGMRYQISAKKECSSPSMILLESMINFEPIHNKFVEGVK